MKETFQVPTPRDIETLIGTELHNVWNRLCQLIEQSYEMEQLWNRGGKAWTYEYKYRKGGKTLCALYAKERTLGFMVILGKDERAKFEMQRELFSNEVQMIYDEATTFHDGKWIMFELKNTELFNDMERLLLIKYKRQNKLFHFHKTFCSEFDIINTKQNVHFNKVVSPIYQFCLSLHQFSIGAKAPFINKRD